MRISFKWHFKNLSLSTWLISNFIHFDWSLPTNSEAATRGVLQKKVFLKISQNSQGNSCARASSLTYFRPMFHQRTCIDLHLYLKRKSSTVFFKHFASKNQLPAFYINGTLVENGLIKLQAPERLLLSIQTYPLFSKYRSSRPEMFCEKGVFRNFGKFTGKHLCLRLFF